jgi:shikimate dehydrogenase
MAGLKRVGLIGYPATYSLSPAMHNAAFKDLGLEDWYYNILATPPDELANCVKTLAEKGYVGANVTVPHKQAIIPLIDSVVLSARGANAVNTLLIEDGKIAGHNTDVVGIRADLAANGVKLKGIHALILGAGGAAHAAVLSLANAGAKVTVMNRHNQRAWDLYNTVKRGVSSQFNVTVEEFSTLDRVAPEVDLVINCTPAGMVPDNIEISPWREDVPIPKGIVVYDMVYRPAETLFMQQATAAGARAIGGLGMLVQQGAASFQMWTGQEANIDVMRAAAEAELENKS